ncbi:cytochrome P450 [Lentzea sp. NBRC 105346]|uniref:cytochrome P450 n=1 Tax=Lentzea sp. NBRC 105346 TaxID=3032205 RepID=UPI00249FE79D|nr:cytochrome P450 [Lentzea sp. NBRC 105346]GLZ30059.1 cytochrome P450 [Lentzea sp. NBRC 105346]
MTAPGRIPLLGHVLRMGRNPIAFLQELRGHGDVVAFYVGPRRIHVVNSPELIRRVLVTDAHHFQRGEVFAKARMLLGDGLATADEPVHMRQRRVMQPAFHHDRIASYRDVMRAEVEKFVSTLEHGRQVEFDQALQQLTFTVTAKALFSTAPDAVDEVRRSLGPVLNGITVRAVLPFYEHIPTQANRRFEDSLRRITAAVDGVIAAYRKTGTDHGDLLSMLVVAMDDDDVRTQVMNILMAGTETTATTLSWAFYELARNPDVPMEPDRVLNETLRLHTPIWLLTRRVAEPIRLGDTELDAGAEVLVSLPTLHRDPELFPDPMRFDPSRSFDQAFLPFGAGRHKCIGDRFAWAEMTEVLTSVTARWRMEIAPGREIREVARAFLRPNALPMIPRSV